MDRTAGFVDRTAGFIARTAGFVARIAGFAVSGPWGKCVQQAGPALSTPSAACRTLTPPRSLLHLPREVSPKLCQAPCAHPRHLLGIQQGFLWWCPGLWLCCLEWGWQEEAARSTETGMNSNSPSVLLQHQWTNEWEKC